MTALSSDIRRALLTLGLATLLAAGIVLLLWQFRPGPVPAPPVDALQPIEPQTVIAVSTARDMGATLDRAGVHWPPAGTRIPAVVVAGLPEDMPSLPADERATLFLRMVLVPTVLANQHIRQERRYLETMTRHGPPPTGSEAREGLKQLADRYRVDGALTEPATLEQLQQRVQEVPPALVLAVAALESGWGLSRFAVRSNALFGQWSGRVGQTPQQFDRPDASVRHFMHALNTHPAFAQWREARHQGASLTTLSEALAPWSPAHEHFSDELQTIIRTHQLDQLPTLSTADH